MPLAAPAAMTPCAPFLPPMVDRDIDLRTATSLSLIGDAFETLFRGGDRYVRVVGPGMSGVEFVEIVLDEKPLHDPATTRDARIQERRMASLRSPTGVG